jgi:outer membrane biosynthesis protein TonB
MTQRSREQDRRFTRALVWGTVVSAALHAAAFLVFSQRPLPRSPFAAAGDRMGDVRAASGGGLEAVQLATPRTRLRPPPPIPAPTPDVTQITPPEPELLPEEIPAIALGQEVPTPGNEGLAEGPGLLEGTGQGDGGTEAEGRFDVVPPKPRGMILPPSDRPEGVRGRQVEVWVWVTATGRVVPDSTRLNPSTGNRGFDRRLREHAAGWVFDAALRDGEPVGEWYHFTIEL